MLPFQKLYSGLQGNFSKLWKGYTELNDVKTELKKTRDKLQHYVSITEDLVEIKKENIRLRKLLGRKEKIPYNSIHATIISKDPDNWFRTVIINRGRDDGIKMNMPVLAYFGGQKAIVGKIVEVRGSISRIIPVISPNIRVGVKLQENRFPGLLYGFSSNSNLCVIDYVSRSAILKFGDVVVTSGQGGVFPPGLHVGRILKTEILESSAYQRAVIKPLVDYNLLEEVFVIKKEADNDLLKLFEGKQ